MKRIRIKRKFLNSVCPFEVLEEKITWGELIELYIKGFFGAILLYIFIFLMALAGYTGV